MRIAWRFSVNRSGGRRSNLSKYRKRYGRIIDSYFRNYSSSIQQCCVTKPLLIRELARRLNLHELRRTELIFKTTVRCLCMNLSEEEVGLLADRLPRGMKSWTDEDRTSPAASASSLHGFLSILKHACGFYSMEEALGAAKEVFSSWDK